MIFFRVTVCVCVCERDINSGGTEQKRQQIGDVIIGNDNKNKKKTTNATLFT